MEEVEQVATRLEVSAYASFDARGCQVTRGAKASPEQLPELPLLAYRVLDALDRRHLTVQWRSEELERLRVETRSYRAQMIAAVAGSALVLSGTGILVLGPGPILTVAVAKALAIGLYVVGGLFLSAGWRGAPPQR